MARGCSRRPFEGSQHSRERRRTTGRRNPMQIIATARGAVNSTVRVNDPGALSSLADLDADHNGSIEASDISHLGADRWKSNQAKILQAFGAHGSDTTVRGLLHLGPVPSA